MNTTTPILPKITSRSEKEFKEIEDLLKTLPASVLCQIEKAENNIMGLQCDLRYNNCPEQLVTLPRSTTQIKDHGDSIGIYCRPFYFKISGEMKKSILEFYFTEEKPNNEPNKS